jgi:hypothetical protein
MLLIKSLKYEIPIATKIIIIKNPKKTSPSFFPDLSLFLENFEIKEIVESLKISDTKYPKLKLTNHEIYSTNNKNIFLNNSKLNSSKIVKENIIKKIKSSTIRNIFFLFILEK